MRQLYWLVLCGAFIAALFLTGCSETPHQDSHGQDTRTEKQRAQDLADAETIGATSRVNVATIVCKPFEGEENKACLKEKLRELRPPMVVNYCDQQGHCSARYQ